MTKKMCSETLKEALLSASRLMAVGRSVGNWAFMLLALCCMGGCTHETYDTGDMELSYLRADFVEAHTVAAKQVDSAVTDEGLTLQLAPYATAEWATTADSIYRALLYYNKVEDGTTKPVAIVSVPVLRCKPLASDEQLYTDPVVLESSWLSKNGKYLNLGLLLKTGVADGIDALQKVGVVQHDVVTQADGTHLYDLQFFHQQNGVPEYYSARTYISIPLTDMRQGDTIRLSVNTYQGEVVKEFLL